jgi:hypothetical protein
LVKASSQCIIRAEAKTHLVEESLVAMDSFRENSTAVRLSSQKDRHSSLMVSGPAFRLHSRELARISCAGSKSSCLDIVNLGRNLLDNVPMDNDR